jgi:hypothetical protein
VPHPGVHPEQDATTPQISSSSEHKISKEINTKVNTAHSCITHFNYLYKIEKKNKVKVDLNILGRVHQKMQFKPEGKTYV